MKTIILIIAWALIAVPLGWGVHQSVQKSMPLFHGQSQAVGKNNGDILLFCVTHRNKIASFISV